MPINPHDYHPQWKRISRYIRLERAKGCCERCGLPNLALIIRKGREWRYANEFETKMLAYLQGIGWKQNKALKYLEITKVVITTAHLDRNPENNDERNLMALCQKCHLTHDRDENAANRNYGKRWRKKHQLKLFTTEDNDTPHF